MCYWICENFLKFVLLLMVIIVPIILLIIAKRKKVIFSEYYIYIIMVYISNIFVVYNWEKCVELQFFEDFDGYNIIFITWIVLLLLSIFKIDFNGISSFNSKKNNDKKIEDINASLESLIANVKSNESKEESKGEE